MQKYLSREFILAVALIVIGTIAMFSMDKVGYTECVFNVTATTEIYTTGKTFQKIKGQQ